MSSEDLNLSVRIQVLEDLSIYDSFKLQYRWQWNRSKATTYRYPSATIAEQSADSTAFLLLRIPGPLAMHPFNQHGGNSTATTDEGKDPFYPFPVQTSSPSLMLVVTLFASHRKPKTQVLVQQKLGTCHLLVNQIQALTRPTYSFGIQSSVPTFALFVDPDRSSWGDGALLTKLLPGPYEPLLSPVTALKQYTQKDMDRVYEHLIQTHKQHQWIHPLLYQRSLMFDVRDIHVWTGNMFPDLFSDQYQVPLSYAPSNIHYYEYLLHLAMAEFDLTPKELDLLIASPSAVQKNIGWVAELLGYVLTKSARMYMYAFDTVYKGEGFKRVSAKRVKEQDSKYSWRAQELLPMPYGLVHHDDSLPETVSQTGDQVTVVRTFPDPGEAQVDCDDAAVHIAIDAMHLQKMALRGDMKSRPHAALWSVIHQWTVAVCICTMSCSETHSPESHRQYVYESAPSTKDAPYDQHVISIGFPSPLFATWVRRGRSCGRGNSPSSPPLSSSSSLLPANIPVLTLEGIAHYRVLQHVGGSGEGGSPPHPQRSCSEFYRLVWSGEPPLPHASVWKFQKPQWIWEGGRMYAHCASVYSSAMVDHMSTGQLWWYNTKTEKYGIPFEQMQKTTLDKDDGVWCLRQLGEQRPTLFQSPTSYAQEEVVSTCSDGDLSSQFHMIPLEYERESKTGNSQEQERKLPVFLYTRKVDWVEFGKEFLEWCQVHQDKFRVGTWSMKLHRFIPYPQTENMSLLHYVPKSILLTPTQTLMQVAILWMQ